MKIYTGLKHNLRYNFFIILAALAAFLTVILSILLIFWSVSSIFNAKKCYAANPPASAASSKKGGAKSNDTAKLGIFKINKGLWKWGKICFSGRIFLRRTECS